MKLKLLDLFCGDGGAGVGYARAGFDVTGVDLVKRRRYPLKFIQANALTFPLEGFDAIHASPPCQAYSITKHTHSVKHPELLAPTRRRLIKAGVPYVIENVPGAPLIDPIVLCGTMFDLTTVDDDGTILWLKRHRLFESNVPLHGKECRCAEYRAKPGHWVGGVYGGGCHSREYARKIRKGGYTPSVAKMAGLLGVDWKMTEHGLHQAIPPVYTEFLGRQLRRFCG